MDRAGWPGRGRRPRVHHARGSGVPVLRQHEGHVTGRPAGRAGLLAWSTGHNPTGLCLFTDLGFKHPVPASFMNAKIPSAAVVGFLGRPDDTPYLETSRGERGPEHPIIVGAGMSIARGDVKRMAHGTCDTW